jgi:hypothetical protein
MTGEVSVVRTSEDPITYQNGTFGKSARASYNETDQIGQCHCSKNTRAKYLDCSFPRCSQRE